jgi:hypothetical protein
MCTIAHTRLGFLEFRSNTIYWNMNLSWNNADVVKKISNVVVINYKCRRC